MERAQAQTRTYYKVYVDVVVEFSAEGELQPLWLRWKDGRIFEIDRVKYCTRVASRKTGDVGLRYTVMIKGKEACLYFEENHKWFVEAKTCTKYE